MINDDRWAQGSPNTPLDVRSYRDMVVNHETGHWLGLGHQTCPGPGHTAPLMMQQSIGLNGCLADPWPTRPKVEAARH